MITVSHFWSDYQLEALILCLGASVLWAPLVLGIGAALSGEDDRRPARSAANLDGRDRFWISLLIVAIVPALAAPTMAGLGVSLRPSAPESGGAPIEIAALDINTSYTDITENPTGPFASTTSFVAPTPSLAPRKKAPAPQIAFGPLPHEPIVMSASAADYSVGILNSAKDLSWRDALKGAAYLYCYGLALAFLLWLIKTASFALLVRDALPVTRRDITAMVDEWTHRFGLADTPPIFHSSAVSSVCIFGVFRPKIIFPSALLKTAEKEALSLMAAHELAHIRRKDHALFSATALTRILFWFNPFIRRLASRCELAAEESADALVLSTGVNRRHYAACFVNSLKFAAHYNKSGNFGSTFASPAFTPLAFTPHDRRGRRRRLDAILSASGPLEPTNLERQIAMARRRRQTGFAVTAFAGLGLAMGQAALAVNPNVRSHGLLHKWVKSEGHLDKTALGIETTLTTNATEGRNPDTACAPPARLIASFQSKDRIISVGEQDDDAFGNHNKNDQSKIEFAHGFKGAAIIADTDHRIDASGAFIAAWNTPDIATGDVGGARNRSLSSWGKGFVNRPGDDDMSAGFDDIGHVGCQTEVRENANDNIAATGSASFFGPFSATIPASPSLKPISPEKPTQSAGLTTLRFAMTLPATEAVVPRDGSAKSDTSIEPFNIAQHLRETNARYTTTMIDELEKSLLGGGREPHFSRKNVSNGGNAAIQKEIAMLKAALPSQRLVIFPTKSDITDLEAVIHAVRVHRRIAEQPRKRRHSNKYRNQDTSRHQNNRNQHAHHSTHSQKNSEWEKVENEVKSAFAGFEATIDVDFANDDRHHLEEVVEHALRQARNARLDALTEEKRAIRDARVALKNAARDQGDAVNDALRELNDARRDIEDAQELTSNARARAYRMIENAQRSLEREMANQEHQLQRAMVQLKHQEAAIDHLLKSLSARSYDAHAKNKIKNHHTGAKTAKVKEKDKNKW